MLSPITNAVFLGEGSAYPQNLYECFAFQSSEYLDVISASCLPIAQSRFRWYKIKKKTGTNFLEFPLRQKILKKSYLEYAKKKKRDDFETYPLIYIYLYIVPGIFTEINYALINETFFRCLCLLYGYRFSHGHIFPS